MNFEQMQNIAIYVKELRKYILKGRMLGEEMSNKHDAALKNELIVAELAMYEYIHNHDHPLKAENVVLRIRDIKKPL